MFQMMDRGQIRPSPLNPRKHFDREKLQELAATMANGVGIIEPLVVRPRPELNCYELIAGERRWRAAEIAGLEKVPVVVKEHMTDAQVLEIMVIENNQREDVNPLEEAEGFRQLLALGAVELDALADRLGRSRKYVYDRMKLLELVPEAQQLLHRGLITAGHAILLARVTPAQQRQAIAVNPRTYGYDKNPLFEFEGGLRHDDEGEGEPLIEVLAGDKYRGLKAKSVRELEAWIARHCRFVPTADVNLELFPATARAMQQSRKVISITRDYIVNPDAKGEGQPRVYTERAWKRADGQQESKACDRSVLGVVVVGPGYGEAFQVCIHKECDVHWKAERVARERAAKRRTAGSGPSAASEESRAQKQQRLEQEREESERKAWAAALPKILEACATRVKALSVAALVEELVQRHESADYKAAQAMLGGKKDAESVLRALVLMPFLDDGRSNYRYGRESFGRNAKDIGVDVAPFLKAVQTSAKAPVDPSKPKALAKSKTKSKAKAVAKKVAKLKKAV